MVQGKKHSSKKPTTKHLTIQSIKLLSLFFVIQGDGKSQIPLRSGEVYPIKSLLVMTRILKTLEFKISGQLEIQLSN